jgi:two-component system, chemotaxis family, response regulator Rcp1
VPSQDVNILVVDDDDIDVRAVRRGFQQQRISNPIFVAHDGVEGLEMLRGTGGKARLPRPYLILLDLNMPRMDGREVLAELKADDALKHLPVVVLTTSEAEQDILRSYKLHANCYITKPVDLDQFINVVRSIEDFWLSVVKLPAVTNERLRV